jgi:mannose/fructose/N-acetylgalactosamine-specific phosphotransferase system component IIC
MQRGKHKWADSIFWLIFFLVVQIVVSVFTFSDWRSIFAIVAGLISTVAYFVMSEKLYRYLFFALITLWLVNGFIYFYWIAVIHDAFAWVSIVIAIFRYNIKSKKEQKAVAETESEKN